MIIKYLQYIKEAIVNKSPIDKKPPSFVTTKITDDLINKFVIIYIDNPIRYTYYDGVIPIFLIKIRNVVYKYDQIIYDEFDINEDNFEIINTKNTRIDIKDFTILHIFDNIEDAIEGYKIIKNQIKYNL